MDWKKGTIIKILYGYAVVLKTVPDVFYPTDSFFTYSSHEYVRENSVEVRRTSGRKPKVGDQICYWYNGSGQTFWMFQSDQTTDWKMKLAIPDGTQITTEIIDVCFRKMTLKCHLDAGGSDQSMRELLKARQDALVFISTK